MQSRRRLLVQEAAALKAGSQAGSKPRVRMRGLPASVRKTSSSSKQRLTGLLLLEREEGAQVIEKRLAFLSPVVVEQFQPLEKNQDSENIGVADCIHPRSLGALLAVVCPAIL